MNPDSNAIIFAKDTSILKNREMANYTFNTIINLFEKHIVLLL